MTVFPCFKTPRSRVKTYPEWHSCADLVEVTRDGVLYTLEVPFHDGLGYPVRPTDRARLALRALRCQYVAGVRA